MILLLHNDRTNQTTAYRNLILARYRHINDIRVPLVHFRPALMGMKDIP